MIMKAKQKPTTVLELKALHKGTLQLEYQQAVNYALMGSGMKILQSSILENKEDIDWREVRISVSGQYILPNTCILDTLQSRHSLQLDTLNV